MADYQIQIGTKLDTSGIDTTLNKYKGKSIEVKSKLDTTGIKNAIANYKAKPIEVGVKLNTKGIAGKIKEVKPKTPIEISAKLNTQNIGTAIKNYKAKDIKLNVDLNFKGVAGKITEYSKNAQPIKLKAELNKSAVGNAINEFNKKINAAESKVKIKIKAEPDLKGVNKKIASYEASSPLRVKVKINKTDINNQIKQYGESDKYITVKAKLDNGAISQAIKEYKTNTPIKVDLELDHTDIDKKVGSYAAKGGVQIPARLVPSLKGFDASITKTPVKINATLDSTDIDKVINGFKPKSKIGVGVKLEPKDINAQIAQLPKPTERIDVGAKLDTSSFNADIALFQPTAVLGVDSYLIVEDIEEQLRTYVPKTPLKVNVKINDSDVINASKKQNTQEAVQVNVQLNREKLNEQIKSFKSTSKVTIGIKLDSKGISEQIKKMEPKTKIRVGVQIDPNDVARQIENIDTKFPIKLSVELDNNGIRNVEDRIDNIGQQIQSLGNVNINFGGGNRGSAIGNADGGFVSIENNLNQVTAAARNTTEVIKVMREKLSNMKFDNSSIDTVARDLENMGISVKEAVAELRGQNLDITVKGIDSAGEAVTVIRRLDTATGEISNVGAKIKQSFGSGDDFIREVNKEMTNFIKMQEKISQKKIEIHTIKSQNGDLEYIATLERQLESLEFAYSELMHTFMKKISINADIIPMDDIKRFDDAIIALNQSTEHKIGQMTNNAAVKRQIQDYKELATILKLIGNLEVNIEKLKGQGGNVNQIQALESQLRGYRATYDHIMKQMEIPLNDDQWESIKLQIFQTENKLEQLEAAYLDTREKMAQDIKTNIGTTIERDITLVHSKFEGLSNQTDELRQKLELLDSIKIDLDNAAAENDVEGLIEAHTRYEAVLKDVKAQIDICKTAERDAFNKDSFDLDKERALIKLKSLFSEDSEAAKKFASELDRIQKELAECGDPKGLKLIDKEIDILGKKVKESNALTQTFGQKLKKQFAQYSSYLSVASLFSYASRGLRSMFEQVKLIDSAMTELKKVTDETDASYNKFLKNAASRSKELGTTIDGLISSTADFARLGYGFEDAQGLAEVANIYAVVGDEIEGVEGATESLISTLAAFKEQAGDMSDTDFAMSIIDIYNELGNKFAISSGGLGEALERSASSLAAANNTLEQSAALITAANEVVQNPEKVGTAFKTISMRIRGAKTELEEAGESTEGMVESTATLRAEIQALSGVDIMLDKNNFKSTYQIMDELSQKWEDLSDIQQAKVA